MQHIKLKFGEITTYLLPPGFFFKHFPIQDQFNVNYLKQKSNIQLKMNDAMYFTWNTYSISSNSFPLKMFGMNHFIMLVNSRKRLSLSFSFVFVSVCLSFSLSVCLSYFSKQFLRVWSFFICCFIVQLINDNIFLALDL